MLPRSIPDACPQESMAAPARGSYRQASRDTSQPNSHMKRAHSRQQRSACSLQGKMAELTIAALTEGIQVSA